MTGIRMSVIKYVASTLIAATTPNSTNMVLFVKYNTAKPIAVVIFARNKVMPMVSMVLVSAFILLPCALNSLWYLLIRKIQFGKPMTMIKGAISPDRTVILYPNSSMIPIDQTTPITTTINEKKTVVSVLKNIHKIIAVTITASVRNKVISALTLVIKVERMYGMPE